MTPASVRQEAFRLDDGEVLIMFPATISRRCVEDLKVQFDLFIERLRWPADGERQSFLKGLAELAAYGEANGEGMSPVLQTSAREESHVHQITDATASARQVRSRL